MIDRPDNIERGFLAPLGGGILANVNTLAEFIDRFQSPIKRIGLAIHTEFSGINLRGIRTHDIEVRRNMGTNVLHQLDFRIPPKAMLIRTDLTPEEMEPLGGALRLFFNELQIQPKDVTKGTLQLDRIDEHIENSGCHFEVRLLVNEDLEEAGKSGLSLNDHGMLDLAPSPMRANFGDIEFKSDQEKKKYELLTSLEGARSKGIFTGEYMIYHPLVAAAIVEAAQLVSRAIYSRKLKPDFFEETS